MDANQSRESLVVLLKMHSAGGCCCFYFKRVQHLGITPLINLIEITISSQHCTDANGNALEVQIFIQIASYTRALLLCCKNNQNTAGDAGGNSSSVIFLTGVEEIMNAT